MSDSTSITDSMIWCAKTGELQSLKSLLKDNPGKVNELMHGRSLLHYAADAGNFDVLKELVNSGANVNSKDKFGLTPLLAAIYEDHTDCVKYLLEQNADVNGISPDGQTYDQCCTNEEIRSLVLKYKKSNK